MADFTLDMSKFANKSLGEIEQVVRKTAIDLTTSIIKSTPVDTGRARANWFVSFEDAIDNTTEDTNSAKALSKATTEAKTGVPLLYIVVLLPPFIIGVNVIPDFLISIPKPFIP